MEIYKYAYTYSNFIVYMIPTGRADVVVAISKVSKGVAIMRSIETHQDEQNRSNLLDLLVTTGVTNEILEAAIKKTDDLPPYKLDTMLGAFE